MELWCDWILWGLLFCNPDFTSHTSFDFILFLPQKVRNATFKSSLFFCFQKQNVNSELWGKKEKKLRFVSLSQFWLFLVNLCLQSLNYVFVCFPVTNKLQLSCTSACFSCNCRFISSNSKIVYCEVQTQNYEKEVRTVI